MRSLNFPHNPRIDEIRCLAASLVFFFHFYLYFYKPDTQALAGHWNWFGLFTEGHTGVGLFFTLSGFLFMQIALHHKNIVYSDFIRNRFLRIFPLFITVFFIAISTGRDQFKAEDVLYLMFSNLGDAPTSKHFITGAAWTISLEFTFYLVFPFLARFAIETGPRYLAQLLVLMLFIKLAAYGVSERSTHMLFSTVVGRFDQFLIGMLAAFLYRDYQAFFKRHGRIMLLAACAVVVLNSALQARYGSFFSPSPKAPFWVTWSMQESLGWSFFIIAWLAADLVKPRWLDKALQHGGDISFSFYLLHALIIYLAYDWLGPVTMTGNRQLDAVLLMLLVYAATWAFATLSYTTIEQPFLRMRHRYAR